MGRPRELKSYLADIKKAKGYVDYIAKVKEEHDIIKKEEFIESVKTFMDDKNFITLLGERLCGILDMANRADLDDNFYSIMSDFNVDVAGSSFYFDDVEIYETECWFYRNTSYDYHTSREDVGTIPKDIDICTFAEKLEEFEERCLIELEKIRKRKEEEARRKKEEDEKAEYQLYLKLKAKYEK